MLKAQPPRIPDKKVERIVQNFEQVELNDLLKDESLRAEYNQFLITKLQNFDWMRPIMLSNPDMHVRYITFSEAVGMTGVSESTIRSDIKSG